MKKFNDIRQTEKFSRLVVMFSDIEVIARKNNGAAFVSHLVENLKEFVGFEYMQALQFREDFSKIQDYCEKFFDCKEKGFSYELGCRYQKIDFDSVENIDGEINFLNSLLKIYSPEFIAEKELIYNLISDLEEFRPIFAKYAAS